jgi:hypothetical protein
MHMCSLGLRDIREGMTLQRLDVVLGKSMWIDILVYATFDIRQLLHIM